jgi:preprotein translocase subunit SecE
MASNVAIENVKQWPQTVKDYYGELRNEMKRVTWPSRRQVESTTAVVIITVFLFGAYFWLVDAVLTRAVMQVFRLLSK